MNSVHFRVHTQHPSQAKHIGTYDWLSYFIASRNSKMLGCLLINSKKDLLHLTWLVTL